MMDEQKLRIEHLEQTLMSAAFQLDQWAKESRLGGWSTHQVKANTELANDLRRVAAGSSAPPKPAAE